MTVAILPETIVPLAALDCQSITDHILANGGITLNPSTGQLITSGFSVSTYKDRETVTPMDDFDAFDVEDFIICNSGSLALAGNCLGGWIENGLVYLDISTVVEDCETAKSIGRTHNQIAVFDLDSFETIYC